jgi:hypothetical protein
MFEEILKELFQAKTKEEILKCKECAVFAYESLFYEMENDMLSISNFNDIEMLDKLNIPMMAYYGPDFYKEHGIPFLEEHNPSTIIVIKLTTMFYIVRLIEMIEAGFFDEGKPCSYINNINEDYEDMLHENEDGMVFKYTDTNLLETFEDKNLFLSLLQYFTNLILIEDDNREIAINNGDCTYGFYIDDSEYEEVMEFICEKYRNSYFEVVMNRILGVYQVRFTKMKYITEYQNLFVKVMCDYINQIVL